MTVEEIRAAWTAHEGFDEASLAYMAQGHFFIGDLIAEVDRLNAQGAPDADARIAELEAQLVEVQAEADAQRAKKVVWRERYQTLKAQIEDWIPPTDDEADAMSGGGPRG